MNTLLHYLPKQAFGCLQQNPYAVLIDVRSEAENKFVGRPIDCVFVPWVDEPDWQPDPENFVAAINRFGCELDTEIILICRSGYRSADAGRYLIDQGFINVAHVISGFEGDLDEHHQRGNINGWRHDSMPWEQC